MGARFNMWGNPHKQGRCTNLIQVVFQTMRPWHATLIKHKVTEHMQRPVLPGETGFYS